jgi:hypothetical protein
MEHWEYIMAMAVTQQLVSESSRLELFFRPWHSFSTLVPLFDVRPWKLMITPFFNVRPWNCFSPLFDAGAHDSVSSLTSFVCCCLGCTFRVRV